MIDIEHIRSLIKSNDLKTLASYMKVHSLTMVDNKIVATKQIIEDAREYFDSRQLVRKILLNSALMCSALTQ
jgi:hypothetical protein